MDDPANLALVLLLVGVALAALGCALFVRAPGGPAVDNRGRVTGKGILNTLKWVSVIIAPVALFLALFLGTFDWNRLD